MNINKTTLAVAVSFALAQNVMAAVDQETCNANEDLSGWGVWCGADTYLASLDPTAAGPGGNFDPGLPPVIGSDIGDSDPFGGDVEPKDPDDPVDPVDPVDPEPTVEKVYYRATNSWTHVSAHEYGAEGGPTSFDAEGAAGIGTLSLALVPGETEENGSEGIRFQERLGGDGPDRISGTVFDKAGAPVDDFDYFNAEGSGANVDFYDTGEQLGEGESLYSGNFNGGSGSSDPAPEPVEGFKYTSSGTNENIHGMGLFVQDDATEEMLQEYWLGWRDTSSYQNSSNDGYGGDGGWNGDYSYRNESNGSRTFFVGGTLTPQSDIDALAGEVAAEYYGISGLHGQNVHLTVNFNQQSFAGEFSGGNFPGGPGYSFPSNGDFTASGNIQGQNIVATSFGPGVSSGELGGSFVGPEAIGVVGAYEITKQDGAFNDAFGAIREEVLGELPEPD